MLHWAQEIKGYVTIRVWGYSVERFLNLCGNHDILVWDIENHDGYTTMNISVKGFYEMKPLLKKTGTRASIVQKYGLPFFLSRWQKRKIFLAGLIGCMLFWILTSGFIWNIRIQGNYTLTEDVLLDYLKSQGVYVSMRQKNVHIEELEKALREHYDVITWTSVQIDGTTLLVFLKENEMPEYDTGQKSDSAQTEGADVREQARQSGSDLVAAKAGVISYIVTRNGVPQVMPGDTVAEGDILVCGAVPVYNEDETVRKYQFCDADADILIRYPEKVELSEKVAYERKVYTGREKKLPFLGVRDREVEIKIGEPGYESYDVEGETKQLRLLDHWYLPLYYGVRTAREYEMCESRHSKEEMQQLLQDRWAKIIEGFSQKGVQIIEKNVTIKKNDKNWVLSVSMVLEEPAVNRKRTAAEQIAEETEPDGEQEESTEE